MNYDVKNPIKKLLVMVELPETGEEIFIESYYLFKVNPNTMKCASKFLGVSKIYMRRK